MGLLGQDAVGSIAGGTEVLIAGDAATLDMSTLGDPFTGGAINPARWSVASGRAQAVVGGLELRASGETSAVRTTGTAVTLDAAVMVEGRLATLGPGSELTVCGLALWVDANNVFRLEVVRKRDGGRYARVTATLGGVQVYSRDQIVDAAGAGAFGGELRLVRAAGTVVALVSGGVVATVAWTTTAAAVEIRAVAPAGATVLTRVTRYVRQPVVRFDGVVATGIGLATPSRVVAYSPPRAAPGVVGLTVVGSDGATEVAVPGGFTYTIDPNAVLVGQSGPTLMMALER